MAEQSQLEPVKLISLEGTFVLTSGGVWMALVWRTFLKHNHKMITSKAFRSDVLLEWNQS